MKTKKRKESLRWFGAVGMIALLGGCASFDDVDYTVTSFAEVPLKAKAQVKVVAKDAALRSVADSVKKNFARSGAFKVVDDKADYWFVLSGSGQYVNGAPQNRISVSVRENESGGCQVLTPVSMNQASSAKGVSVAVYDARTLAPVTYIDIPVYSGDNTAKVVRGEAAYDAALANEVVERIQDAFVTSSKTVQTPVPRVADVLLRELFAKMDYKGIVAAYERNRVDLAKLCVALRNKTYEGKDADTKLGNHYLYLLAREAQTLDTDELKKIRDEQMMILEATEEDGLATAVPVALARLEYKLANLGE